MRAWIAAIFGAMLVALGVGSPGDGESLAPPMESVQAAGRFLAIDLLIDPHGKSLAAYQVQVVASLPGVTLVGVEGGDDPAFSAAPYYDRRAILSQRIILAAYTTEKRPPTAKTRVATLMVRVTGEATPAWTPTLHVAVSPDATPIAADISLSIAGSEGAK